MSVEDNQRRRVRASAGGNAPTIRLVLTLLGASLLVALIFAAPRIPGLLRLEASSADLRTALLSHRTTREHPGIALVTISDETLAPFAVKSPIDRSFLASLLSAIDAAGPRAIGLDIYFIRGTDPTKDTALQAALRDAKATVVLAALDERGQITADQRAFQDTFIASTRRSAGNIQLQIERDGVIRNVAEPAPHSRYADSFSLLLARTVRPDAQPPHGKIAWLQQVAPGFLPRIVNWNGASPFTSVTAQDVVRGASRDKLQGKIVLVGADFAYIDRHRTPLTIWNGEETAGVAIHAQIIAQMVDGRRIVEVTPNAARVATLLLGGLGGFLGWRYFRRRFDFLSWGIATFALTAIDALVFSSLRLIVPFMMLMLAWFAGVTTGHNLRHLYEWRQLRYASNTGSSPAREPSAPGPDRGDAS